MYGVVHNVITGLLLNIVNISAKFRWQPLVVIVIIANCGGVDCNIVYCGVDQTWDQVQLGGMVNVSVFSWDCWDEELGVCKIFTVLLKLSEISTILLTQVNIVHKKKLNRSPITRTRMCFKDRDRLSLQTSISYSSRLAFYGSLDEIFPEFAEHKQTVSVSHVSCKHRVFGRRDIWWH